MEKVYSAKEVEAKWSKYWIDNKTFSAKPDKNKKPFTIVIPPPNITGVLHMGHALNNTLQDIIIRFKKMSGFNALWVPGTDHGGIATQSVVEKILKKEGKTKFDLGREKFLEKMRAWRKETGDSILEQLKKLGCGLDWDRTAFTMDESRSKAVQKAFIKLFDKGLIYRGKRLVNWCPHCGTALSDIEVEYENEKSNLWYIKYPFSDGSGYITVATTRPETMLGDTAVAVNPDDTRYLKVSQKTIKLPLIDREIKIVKDFTIEKEFGTGAVKVTPAHDANDDAIAKRHNLEYIEIIDAQGKMINVPDKYKGLSVSDARKAIVADLQEQGFIEKIEDYSHSVGRCYRCMTTIEPLMSWQWFLNVDDMSKRAVKAAKNKETKFYPQSWEKPYTLWLENLRDWCISRQIWWGHRIPVYYCVNEKGEKNSCKPIAAYEKPKKCPECSGEFFLQDNDVLDTWFSSALWPFSVFNWGQNDTNTNEDLNYFYPTSTLVTGHEILYLWVARMVQFGLEFIDDIPFSDIFLNGIVRDKHGKKMSKTLGNVVDPILIMDKFGTDALRFALSQAAVPGRDMQISDENFLSARNFANKIWNASRFIIMNSSEAGELDKNIKPKELADRWILDEFEDLSAKVQLNFTNYDIDKAARELYDFLWTKFCDWYIELSKIRIASTNIDEKKQVLSILIYVLKGTLQLLSPIMPFITSEIWEILNENSKETKIISETIFPLVKNKKEVISISQQEMKIVQDIIVKIRTLRSQTNIAPGLEIKAIFNILDDAKSLGAKNNQGYIKTLAKLNAIEFTKDIKRPKNSAMTVVSGFEIFLPLEGLIDISKEKNRLQKEISNAKGEIERTTKKLENTSFLERAPKEEIKKIRDRSEEARLKIEKIKENLDFLQ
ncbi:MAG: valine--tRNA ligase [Elusimicrobiota bacterium]|jgi:valyl-tRNA synthetase|nr:valine--tRNA ligase [Elusimicrobiota bacterium]